MQYEAACANIRAAIEGLLLDLRPRTIGATYSAACATRDVAAALHHASGSPDDARWTTALTSLETFLAYCDKAPALRESAALADLRGFLLENGAPAAQEPQYALAS